MIDYNNNIYIKLLSILLAMYAEVWTYTSILSSISSLMSNIMSILYFVIILLIIVVSIFSKGKNILFSNSFVFIVIVCLLAYLLTLTFCRNTKAEFLHFSINVLLPLLITQRAIDSKIFIKTCMILPAFTIFYYNQLFDVDQVSDGISMGLSYALLLPIVSSLIYLKFYFKNDSNRTKRLLLPILIVNFVFLIGVLSLGSRGVVLSIILLVLFFVIFPYNDSIQRIAKLDIHRKTLLLALIIIICFFWDVLYIINEILGIIGLENYSISRSLEFHSEGDAFTGRRFLANITYVEILKKPLIGHGIMTFSNYSSLNYPHNSILQLLFDGGLVLLLCILLPVLSSIKNNWKHCMKEEYILATCLFFSSVPGSLFSHDVWNLPILWMFIGVVIRHSNLKYTNYSH